MPRDMRDDIILGIIQQKRIRNKRPSQIRHDYWQDRPFNSAEAEEQLWQAVIVQAVLDATSCEPKGWVQENRRDALDWLGGDSEDFADVCSRAGLDASTVRKRVKKALACPFLWRTEAGMSHDYERRRALRLKKKREERARKKKERALPPQPLSARIYSFCA